MVRMCLTSVSLKLFCSSRSLEPVTGDGGSISLRVIAVDAQRRLSTAREPDESCSSFGTRRTQGPINGLSSDNQYSLIAKKFEWMQARSRFTRLPNDKQAHTHLSTACHIWGRRFLAFHCHEKRFCYGSPAVAVDRWSQFPIPF